MAVGLVVSLVSMIETLNGIEDNREHVFSAQKVQSLFGGVRRRALGADDEQRSVSTRSFQERASVRARPAGNR